MEEKNSQQNWHLGHGLHIGCRGEMDMELFHDTGLPSKEGIHVTRQNKNTSNKNDAFEAQSLNGGR